MNSKKPDNKLRLLHDDNENPPTPRESLDTWGKPAGYHTNKPITVYPPSYYVAAVMRQHGLTTAALAEEMDAPEEMVVGLLNGTVDIRVGSVAHKLAEVFGPTGSGGIDIFYWHMLGVRYHNACEAPTMALSVRMKDYRLRLATDEVPA